MKTEAEIRQMLINAAQNADWVQVVVNGGPPCFHLEGERFCLRAQRWDGHGETTAFHPFVSLAELLASINEGIKTPAEIRQMVATLQAFNSRTETGMSWHDLEIRALEWVLGEYPPKPVERPAAPPPDPHIAQPMGPGGFAVRSFPGMRQNRRPEEEGS